MLQTLHFMSMPCEFQVSRAHYHRILGSRENHTEATGTDPARSPSVRNTDISASTALLAILSAQYRVSVFHHSAYMHRAES
jgi:hypothetical protein